MPEPDLAARLKAAIARRSPDTLSPRAATVWRAVARWRRAQATPVPRREAVWCLVANVAEVQIYGEDHELRRGTKHFSGNTKVYCFPGEWGDGYENIRVIGRHRGSSRLAVLVMPRRRLTNWRVKLVRHPFVVARMGNAWTEERAHDYVRFLIFDEAAERARRDGFEHVAPDEALLLAVRLGLVDEVERALERGADINTCLDGRSGLSLAITYRHAEVLRRLLEWGADPTRPCGEFTSAREMVERFSSPDEIARLVSVRPPRQ